VNVPCWPGWGWGDDNHLHCGPPKGGGKNPKSNL
jgi:hypothetical protein